MEFFRFGRKLEAQGVQLDESELGGAVDRDQALETLLQQQALPRTQPHRAVLL
jgi:hypothetical protein